MASLLEQFVAGGGFVGTWSFVLLALATGFVAPVGPEITFAAAVGGGLVGDILTRAANRESVKDDDILKALSDADSELAIQRLMHSNRDG
jgi:hypothetical protein